jgi:hypothetical protein
MPVGEGRDTSVPKLIILNQLALLSQELRLEISLLGIAGGPQGPDFLPRCGNFLLLLAGVGESQILRPCPVHYSAILPRGSNAGQEIVTVYILN